MSLLCVADVLLSGGRDITENTLTAPEGIFILQTDKNGVETNRLHVGTKESEAPSAGFTEQACFFGMGEWQAFGLSAEDIMKGASAK